MKNNLKVLGLVALVLFVAILGVACLHGRISTTQFVMLLSGFSIFGTVGTVTYVYPVAGSTPPTALQASRKNMLTCVVVTADGDTGFTIIHNWGQPASDQTNLFPVPIIVDRLAGTGPGLIAVTSRTTNSIVFSKSTAAGSGRTNEITLLRPHTIIR